MAWGRLGKMLYLSFRRVIQALSLKKGHLFSNGRFLLLTYLFISAKVNPELWLLTLRYEHLGAPGRAVRCVLSAEQAGRVWKPTGWNQFRGLQLGSRGSRFPRLCLFAVLLELPCVSQALIAYCSGPLIYPHGTCGAARGVDALDAGGYWSILCGPATWGADVIWVPPLPRVAAAFCSWITKGRFPHLVSVCHWGWNAPFLQCKDQGRPVHERLPSENEATQHAGHLQLPFALGSFCFFSLNKAYEELRQSCIQLARLELEFTQQANSAMMNWLRSFLPLLPSSSFIFSFLFIHSLQECLPKCFLGGGGIQRSIIFVAWLKDFTIHPGSLCTYKIY